MVTDATAITCSFFAQDQNSENVRTAMEKRATSFFIVCFPITASSQYGGTTNIIIINENPSNISSCFAPKEGNSNSFGVLGRIAYIAAYKQLI